MKKAKKQPLEPADSAPKKKMKTIQLRQGDLNVTDLYRETREFGFENNLSAYLRWLIRLGREVAAGHPKSGGRAK